MSLNFNEKGEFRFGKFNYEKARKIARNCAKFKLDNDEEEMACGAARGAATTARLGAGACRALSAAFGKYRPALTALGSFDLCRFSKFSAAFKFKLAAKSLAEFCLDDKNQHEKYLLVI